MIILFLFNYTLLFDCMLVICTYTAFYFRSNLLFSFVSDYINNAILILLLVLGPIYVLILDFKLHL